MYTHLCPHVHTCCIHKVSGAFLPTNGQGEQWASHSARAIGCLQQTNMVLYGEKLLREKTFRISRFCGYLRKFSLQNLGAWCLLAAPVRKVFYVKITNSRKFSPVKVSCYTICSVNCPNSYMDISYVHNYSSHTNTAWTEMLNGWPGLSNSSQWLLVATDRLIFKNLKMLFM